jgi:putative intracellular protease/amidase
MDIAIPLYDRMTALDAIGPYEVLSRLPGARVRFIAKQPGAITTETQMLTLIADEGLEDVPAPDIIVVPGGIGTRNLIGDEQLIDWIRRAHETSRWTTSVCTGSLLLAAAGLLDGLDATTHWLARDELKALGANPVPDRVVIEGKIVTAAGVSAGIDMALTLAAKIAGDAVAQAIQLGIEYDPQPPFDSGAPEKASEDVLAMVRGVQAIEEAQAAAAHA